MFFRVILPLLIISLQILLYIVAIRWIRKNVSQKPGIVWAISALFLVFDAAAVYTFNQHPSIKDFPDWAVYLVVYPYFIWHASTLFLALLSLIFLLVRLPIRALTMLLNQIVPLRQKVREWRNGSTVQRFDVSRRVFLRRGVYGVTGAAFAGSTYGLLIGKNDYELTDVVLPIDNLPPALSGFTIALASDIHSSGFMTREEMEKYAKVINDVNADIIVVDGDFVTGQLEEVYPFAEAFSTLRAPHGVYGVMGNHDFYNRDPERVAREVDDCGIALLRDDKTVIEKNGGRFYLIGVDDIGRETNSSVKMETALGYAPLDIPKILLCHRPYYLSQAAEHGIDLVLSGHTHGGQIVLGRIGSTVLAPASLASRFIAGRYTQGKTQMYVSRGIGTVGLPMRINCPPEITRITLVPGVSSS